MCKFKYVYRIHNAHCLVFVTMGAHSIMNFFFSLIPPSLYTFVVFQFIFQRRYSRFDILKKYYEQVVVADKNLVLFARKCQLKIVKSCTKHWQKIFHNNKMFITNRWFLGVLLIVLTYPNGYKTQQVRRNRYQGVVLTMSTLDKL